MILSEKIILEEQLKEIEHRKRKKRECLKKLDWISLHKKSVLKAMLTFGIYCYLISEKRKAKINSRVVVLDNYVAWHKEEVAVCENKINNCEKDIDLIKEEIETYKADFDNKKAEKERVYNEQISLVRPLEGMIEEKDDSFIMLKSFSGLQYERIIGCYIIHNIEKDKYYVGQSKDVMKRIKQHFNGTVPKNVIFAEDYYLSKLPNKEDIFEIRIIRCETKDELDRMEKELISEYDSWNNGYNGTSGNQ